MLAHYLTQHPHFNVDGPIGRAFVQAMLLVFRSVASIDVA
jgi:hypothetical protein